MGNLAREESQLKVFLTISALTYLVVGFAFLIIPEQILNISNTVSVDAVVVGNGENVCLARQRR